MIDPTTTAVSSSGMKGMSLRSSRRSWWDPLATDHICASIDISESKMTPRLLTLVLGVMILPRMGGGVQVVAS